MDFPNRGTAALYAHVMARPAYAHPRNPILSGGLPNTREIAAKLSRSIQYPSTASGATDSDSGSELDPTGYVERTPRTDTDDFVPMGTNSSQPTGWAGRAAVFTCLQQQKILGARRHGLAHLACHKLATNCPNSLVDGGARRGSARRHNPRPFAPENHVDRTYRWNRHAIDWSACSLSAYRAGRSQRSRAPMDVIQLGRITLDYSWIGNCSSASRSITNETPTRWVLNPTVRRTPVGGPRACDF